MRDAWVPSRPSNPGNHALGITPYHTYGTLEMHLMAEHGGSRFVGTLTCKSYFLA